ncbi:hypothetical protein X772_31370 [Mesorhizobium sp. LSJC280B00]|nr:hypothetical protein X772_31370 [Mesorhizobium sp. LSJC280B00]
MPADGRKEGSSKHGRPENVEERCFGRLARLLKGILVEIESYQPASEKG